MQATSRMSLDLDQFLVAGAPSTAYYVPDFITEAEEAALLAAVARTPAPRWTQLANRRLQNWGGVPHPRGMIAETMPAWLQGYVDRVNQLGVFQDPVNNDKNVKANHVLLNEYLPGQGIMPHLDGPMFHPTISTISLGSHTVLNFYKEPEQEGEIQSLSDRLVTSLLVRPRSLLVLKDDMYHRLLHGIEENKEDAINDVMCNLTNCDHIDSVRRHGQEEKTAGMAVDTQILEHSVTETDYTLFHVNWVPSSPRFVTCGSSLTGEGTLKVYSLASKGITEVSSCKSSKAVRCGTFDGSSLEDRHYVTGDFGGNLTVWDLEEERAVEEAAGAHRDMVNCVAGAAGRLVTGGRDGEVRVWDPRDIRQCALNMRDETTCHDTWTVTIRDHVVCSGYSNGDVRMFDLRAGAATWDTNFGGGGVTSLTLMEDRRLAGGGAGGVAAVWDLQTRHSSQGYTRTDARVEKSVIWSLSPSPDNNSVMMATLGSGAARLVQFKPPGHRVMIGRDGTNVGTPGELRAGAGHQWADRPVTSFHWSGDRAGLGVATGFDQKIRVVIVPSIGSQAKSQSDSTQQ